MLSRRAIEIIGNLALCFLILAAVSLLAPKYHGLKLSVLSTSIIVLFFVAVVSLKFDADSSFGNIIKDGKPSAVEQELTRHAGAAVRGGTHQPSLVKTYRRAARLAIYHGRTVGPRKLKPSLNPKKFLEQIRDCEQCHDGVAQPPSTPRMSVY